MKPLSGLHLSSHTVYVTNTNIGAPCDVILPDVFHPASSGPVLSQREKEQMRPVACVTTSQYKIHYFKKILQQLYDKQQLSLVKLTLELTDIICVHHGTIQMGSKHYLSQCRVPFTFSEVRSYQNNRDFASLYCSEVQLWVSFLQAAWGKVTSQVHTHTCNCTPDLTRLSAGCNNQQSGTLTVFSPPSPSRHDTEQYQTLIVRQVLEFSSLHK